MATQQVCLVRPLALNSLLERLDRIHRGRLAGNNKHHLRITRWRTAADKAQGDGMTRLHNCPTSQAANFLHRFTHITTPLPDLAVAVKVPCDRSTRKRWHRLSIHARGRFDSINLRGNTEFRNTSRFSKRRIHWIVDHVSVASGPSWCRETPSGRPMVLGGGGRPDHIIGSWARCATGSGDSGSPSPERMVTQEKSGSCQISGGIRDKHPPVMPSSQVWPRPLLLPMFPQVGCLPTRAPPDSSQL